MSVKEQQLELLRDCFPMQVHELFPQHVAPRVGFVPVLALETLSLTEAPGSPGGCAGLSSAQLSLKCLWWLGAAARAARGEGQWGMQASTRLGCRRSSRHASTAAPPLCR